MPACFSVYVATYQPLSLNVQSPVATSHATPTLLASRLVAQGRPPASTAPAQYPLCVMATGVLTPLCAAQHSHAGQPAPTVQPPAGVGGKRGRQQVII